MKHRNVFYALMVCTLATGQAALAYESAIPDPQDYLPGLPEGGSFRLQLIGPGVDLTDPVISVRAARIDINEGRGLMDLGVGDGAALFERAEAEARSSIPVGDMGIAPTLGMRLQF